MAVLKEACMDNSTEVACVRAHWFVPHAGLCTFPACAEQSVHPKLPCCKHSSSNCQSPHCFIFMQHMATHHGEVTAVQQLCFTFLLYATAARQRSTARKRARQHRTAHSQHNCDCNPKPLDQEGIRHFKQPHQMSLWPLSTQLQRHSDKLQLAKLNLECTQAAPGSKQ